MAIGGAADLARRLVAARPWLPPELAERLARQYGTVAATVLAGATDLAGLGRDFGGGVHEAEARHLIDREWARCAEDMLFRRTRQGIRMTPAQIAALDDWIAGLRDGAVATASAST